MKKIIFLVVSIFITLNLFSYSMMNRETGNFVYSLDARSSAMANAMTIGGRNLFDSITNPANAGFLKNGFAAQIGVSIIKNNDDRSLPMYNSFDAYAGNSVYASNVHYFNSNAFGISYNKNLSNINISSGFIFRPYIDFNAKYEEEVRNNENSDFDNYPPIIANNYWEGNGVINSYDFLLSASYLNKFSFGLMLSKLQGDDTLERKMIWSKQARSMMAGSDSLLIDQYYKMTRDFDAFSFNIGFGYNISKRWEAGFSYSPKVEFTVDGKVNGISFTAKDSLGNPLAIWGYKYTTELDSLGNEVITDTTTISYDDKYNPYISPARLRLGFVYKPRNIMKTDFHFDFEYVQWSQVNSMYDNAINYFVGVEHKTRFYMPFRFGFGYTTDYKINYDGNVSYAVKITSPNFSVGSGFTYGKHFSVDVSANYSHRTYKALDLFPDSVYDYQDLWSNYNYLNLEDRGWDNPDTVRENFLTLKTSINFTW